MKQLNKAQAVTMLIGALLMVVGAGIYVFTAQAFTAWLFAVGAVAFAAMQLQQTYEGRNITIKRLRRIMSIGDALFIISAALMLENTYNALLPHTILASSIEFLKRMSSLASDMASAHVRDECPSFSPKSHSGYAISSTTIDFRRSELPLS